MITMVPNPGTPIILPSPASRGLLWSFAQRWATNAAACNLVPFDRFITGRIPLESEYPFPYMSLLILAGSERGRSDRGTWARRPAVIHTWVDMDRLQLGEEVAETLYDLYCNQSWEYDRGYVTDVIDGGPPQIVDVNMPEFMYREVIKTINITVWRRRVDTCSPPCGSTQPCGSSSGSFTFH